MAHLGAVLSDLRTSFHVKFKDSLWKTLHHPHVLQELRLGEVDTCLEKNGDKVFQARLCWGSFSPGLPKTKHSLQ